MLLLSWDEKNICPRCSNSCYVLGWKATLRKRNSKVPNLQGGTTGGTSGGGTTLVDEENSDYWSSRLQGTDVAAEARMTWQLFDNLLEMQVLGNHQNREYFAPPSGTAQLERARQRRELEGYLEWAYPLIGQHVLEQYQPIPLRMDVAQR